MTTDVKYSKNAPKGNIQGCKKMRVATQLKLDLSHSQTHFQALHNNAHGTVLLWERGAPGAPWRKLKPGDENIPALLAAQVGQPDRYISVNEFHGW